MEKEHGDESFRREFPTMADHFVLGTIPLLKYLELDTKQVKRDFGEHVGRQAAERTADLSLEEMLDEFAMVWRAHKIGTLAVESRDPSIIQISNCTVCGQLRGNGEGCRRADRQGRYGAPAE